MPFCAQGHNFGVHFAGWVREYPPVALTPVWDAIAARAARILCSGRLRHIKTPLRRRTEDEPLPAAESPQNRLTCASARTST